MKSHLHSRRSRALAALTVVALTSLGACSSADTDDDVPVSIRSATSAPAKDADAAQDEPEKEEPAAPAPAPAGPLELNSSGVLGGTAKAPEYDAGAAGEISVVHVGEFDSDTSTLPFVFRNNTGEAIAHVDPTATARDGDGGLVGTGTGMGSSPAQVPDGGLGMSYIYFESGDLPKDATFEFKFEASPADTSSYNTGDLQVAEVAAAEDGVIGTAVNNNGVTMTGPYSVTVFCFSDDGALESVKSSYTNEDSDLADGDTASFSVDFYGEKCPTYLVGVRGYFA